MAQAARLVSSVFMAVGHNYTAKRTCPKSPMDRARYCSVSRLAQTSWRRVCIRRARIRGRSLRAHDGTSGELVRTVSRPRRLMLSPPAACSPSPFCPCESVPATPSRHHSRTASAALIADATLTNTVCTAQYSSYGTLLVAAMRQRTARVQFSTPHCPTGLVCTEPPPQGRARGSAARWRARVVYYRSFGPKGTSHRRIQGILRENQVVLLCIYNVNYTAHMVKTFGHTPHYMCP